MLVSELAELQNCRRKSDPVRHKNRHIKIRPVRRELVGWLVGWLIVG